MKKILVLEDESNIRSFVVINLRRSGYEPVEAATGGEALEKLQENPGICLALLDVMLPDIDGFEVCRRIRASGSKIGIIMGEVVDLGVKLGIIDKAGAWFTCNGERIQGREGVKDYLEANPEACAKVEKEILENAEKLTQKAQREARAAGKAVDISAEDFEG